MLTQTASFGSLGEPLCGERRLCVGDVANSADRGEENLEEQRRHAHARNRLAEGPPHHWCALCDAGRESAGGAYVFASSTQILRCLPCRRLLGRNRSRRQGRRQGRRRRRHPPPRRRRSRPRRRQQPCRPRRTQRPKKRRPPEAPPPWSNCCCEAMVAPPRCGGPPGARGEEWVDGLLRALGLVAPLPGALPRAGRPALVVRLHTVTCTCAGRHRTARD
jgi:hypothetical protein